MDRRQGGSVGDTGKTPLHISCENGDIETVKTLLAVGAMIGDVDSEGRAPLHYACEHGHVELVDFLLSNGVQAGVVCLKTKVQPLHVASRNGHVEVVRTLLARGADVHAKDVDGCSPLHYASEQGQCEVVMLLLHSGAITEAKNMEGRTPLKFALSSGAVGFCSECEYKQRFKCVCNCRTKFYDAAQILLDHGASLDIYDGYRFNPLHHACAKGDLERVLAILSNRSSTSVNDPISCDRTPLHFASMNGHIKVVEALLAKGAEVDVRDTYRNTPLNFACFGGHADVVRTLLSHGALIESMNSRFMTPFILACQYGNESVVRSLLSNVAVSCPGGSSGDYDTTLRMVARRGHVEIFQALFDHDTDKGKRHVWRNSYFNEAVTDACRANQTETLKMLLDHGASANSYLSRSGRRALRECCSEEAARVLLLYGADVLLLDKMGNSALSSGGSIESFQSIIRCFKTPYNVLLSYGTGSGQPCRKKICNRFGQCPKTDLMCVYTLLRCMERKREAEAIQAIVDCFEAHFIRTASASLCVNDKEKAGEPEHKRFDWDIQKRDVYRAECESELERLEGDTIGDSSATYYHLLYRDRPALRYQPVLANFDPELCLQKYPIYGDMVSCSFVNLRRFFLANDSNAFFSITDPDFHVPPEISELILNHLPTIDLLTLVKICREVKFE